MVCGSNLEHSDVYEWIFQKYTQISTTRFIFGNFLCSKINKSPYVHDISQHHQIPHILKRFLTKFFHFFQANVTEFPYFDSFLNFQIFYIHFVFVALKLTGLPIISVYTKSKAKKSDFEDFKHVLKWSKVSV